MKLTKLINTMLLALFVFAVVSTSAVGKERTGKLDTSKPRDSQHEFSYRTADCCDPAVEPGLAAENQFCAQGHACCAPGSWQCNDALSTSTCAGSANVCGDPCCDPVQEPGAFGNPPCVEGASCCGDGTWQCNAGNGTPTCNAPGDTCSSTCCDPLSEPGRFGNPICIEGATCCSTGQWQCDEGDGSSTCDLDGIDCSGCCDPADEPGQGGTLPCIEGASCCADGTWSCNEGDGSSSCAVDGIACERLCCDPADEPGASGGFPCDEGATCCSDGGWQCNSGDGSSTCPTDGEVCQVQCCDPADEPGQFGNPICIEGASCCGNGRWQCNEGDGSSTCDVDSSSCESCCDPTEQPGAFGNPPCFEGTTCCASGGWQCNAGDGSSTCAVDGLVCEGCCDPREEPGQFGNPACIEGTTCCSTGDWTCNDGAGESICAIDGLVCEPRCCDPTVRPNEIGTSLCETGFSCCADGVWRCNDPSGISVCPADQANECVEICGGFSGIECSDPDDFCKLETGECCCDFLGVCTPFPNACPTVADPVCGCDGVTYGNECEADRAGVSIEHVGPCVQICGGITGQPCDAGEYCKFPDGECCCDQQGICEPIPEDCPAVCDPVCGCDGNTYGNECEAAAAGASVDYRGACFDAGPLVGGVRFVSSTRMLWSAEPDALGYNVYLKQLSHLPPDDFGDCLHHGIADPLAPVNGAPLPGELWMLQVTAVFVQGEGPMGISGNCRVRQPSSRCGPICSLPADVGPCDAVVPRWFFNSAIGSCELFTWGGCGGNANNFETQGQCEAACGNICNLPPDVGPCDAIVPRWFHNVSTGQCEPFIWGGCLGNANNFATEAECEGRCEGSLGP